LTTVTLFNVTLPGLLTKPVYVTSAPGTASVVGQDSVTAIFGVVATVHVEAATLVTLLPLQKSLPVAWTAVVTEQALVGTTKLPVKFAEAPGANEAVVNTGVLAVG
jgi:hypothetical protein